jgi:hypothetical protein
MNMTLSKVNTNYIKATENTAHDFYVVKLRSGWYAFATLKGVHPANPEGRTMGGFTTKMAAVAACKYWSVWMK